MSEKVKRGLGDNSKNNADYTSLYEKKAVKEMMREMQGFAKDSFNTICRISKNINKLITGKDELTERQEDWNIGVDRHNEFVMQRDPNPATNKKKLRKKYKPAKLSKVQLAEVAVAIQKDLDDATDYITDIDATVNAYKDKDSFQEWVECEKEKELN
jgi:hypothetical protein